MINFYKNKLFWAISLLAVVIIMSLFIFTLVSRIGKQPVRFVVAPSSAKILVNGTGVSSGTVYLESGDYTVAVSHPEFNPLELQLTVLEGENEPFVLLLTPATDKGWEIANNDPAFELLEQAAGDNSRKEGIVFADKNPITKRLPYKSGLFNIDYKLKEGSETAIVLVITVHELEREYPRDQISEWGFNIEDFEVEYRPWW